MLTRRAILASLAALDLPLVASAQGAITIVVPYPAGGPVDLLARLIAQEPAGELRQSIVVENRPGGSGIIGTNAVAHAEPDGHMLVLGTNKTHATNQSLIKNCHYDAVNRAVAAALARDSVRSAMAKQGIPTALKSSAEIAAMLPGEVAKWAAVMKAANVVAE
jgi:tripartite-type tricarboxylate transporter receptor subunit TctC